MWDFGVGTNQISNSRGKGHVSYSYQYPFPVVAGQKGYPTVITTNPAKAVAADRNPFWQSPMPTDASSDSPRMYIWDVSVTPNKLYAPSITFGNATYHQKDGQNVLFADQHAKFEKSANCGIEMDNIYTIWGQASINPQTAGDEGKRQCGKNYTTDTTSPGFLLVTSSFQGDVSYCPLSNDDCYLVSDVDKPRSD